jgi:hypothetical protein
MPETHRFMKAYLARIFTEAKSLPLVDNVRWSETHRAEAEPIPEALPPTRRRH